jgi:hypothetical protein
MKPIGDKVCRGQKQAKFRPQESHKPLAGHQIDQESGPDGEYNSMQPTLEMYFRRFHWSIPFNLSRPTEIISTAARISDAKTTMALRLKTL